jgi:hypothetical protein
MEFRNLSPLAAASHKLVVRLSEGVEPSEVEEGCRELLTQNTNGLGSVDTRVVDVASEIVRGVISGVVCLRSPMISAAMRGVSDTGPAGEDGDAERLSISERTCREVRDCNGTSSTDYDAALKGAAPAAKLTVEQLRLRIEAGDVDRARDANAGKQAG